MYSCYWIDSSLYPGQLKKQYEWNCIRNQYVFQRHGARMWIRMYFYLGSVWQSGYVISSVPNAVCNSHVVTFVRTSVSRFAFELHFIVHCGRIYFLFTLLHITKSFLFHWICFSRNTKFWSLCTVVMFCFYLFWLYYVFWS